MTLTREGLADFLKKKINMSQGELAKKLKVYQPNINLALNNPTSMNDNLRIKIANFIGYKVDGEIKFTITEK